MKKSQVRKVVSVLLQKNQKALARVFAESIENPSAQEELLEMIDGVGADRNLKEKKGEGSKFGDDLVKRQVQNNPSRNVKNGKGADKVGTEFNSRKRLAEVKKV